MSTIEQTRDEFGQLRVFVADENADWIAGPFDSRDEAQEWLLRSDHDDDEAEA